MATYKPGEKAPDSGELVEILPLAEARSRAVAAWLSSEARRSHPPLKRAISSNTSQDQKQLTKICFRETHLKH